MISSNKEEYSRKVISQEQRAREDRAKVAQHQHLRTIAHLASQILRGAAVCLLYRASLPAAGPEMLHAWSIEDKTRCHCCCCGQKTRARASRVCHAVAVACRRVKERKRPGELPEVYMSVVEGGDIPSPRHSSIYGRGKKQ